MNNTNPARGMRDFLPEQVRKRNFVIEVIKEVYEKYGFEPLETPTIENFSSLTSKYGEEGDQLMFKILKRGEKLKKKLESVEPVRENDLTDLALRYDLTVPLARVVANYKNDLPKFFKRYQIQPVWRADRPARGRYREFYQCDVDAIGSKSMLVEAELCFAVSSILERLGFYDFVIRINHREILFSLLNAIGIKKEQQKDAIVLLDKLDKLGRGQVSNEFNNRGLDKNAADKLLDLFDLLEGAENSKILAELSRFIGNEGSGKTGIDEIAQVLKLANPGNIRVDASLARGLSYYTGIIYEVNVPHLASSIASGGRYDGLIGMFGKEEIPAVGFSLGLERILLIMEERGMFPENVTANTTDVMVTVWNEETSGESLKLAGELRQKDLRVFVYPQTDKLGKQLKYADQLKAPFVCILGESEIEEKKVSLKNMKTGDQETVSRNEVVDRIKKQDS